MDLKCAIMVIDCYRNFTILLHYMMGVSGVVCVTYLRQHKKTIGRIIGCILLYGLLCLMIQWSVHDSAKYILNKKVIFLWMCISGKYGTLAVSESIYYFLCDKYMYLLSASYVPLLTRPTCCPSGYGECPDYGYCHILFFYTALCR